MAHPDLATTAEGNRALPQIRTISPADLMDALRRGVDDFREMATTHVVFLSLIYSVVGLILARAAFGYELIPLLFPLAAGFALIGPFAAVWLYELSRRREQGLDVAWHHGFEVVRSPSAGAIVGLGVILLVIFSVWIAVAHAIYVANFGYREPASFSQFLRDVFTTRAGWTMIIVGNAVGFVFALAAFVISVVSFPLLIDRNVGLSGAIATSIQAVARNPVTMILWGLIVAAALVAGSIPAFLGLAVVMPVLGHATWHLYRKVVEPGETEPLPHYAPRAPRPAADFPVSLFPTRGERD
jgi:uncharacterized membrane protein